MHAKEVAEKCFAAIASRDPERILGLMSEDVQLWAAEISKPIVGKKVLRPMLEALPGAYELLRLEPEKLIESGNEVAALVRFRGKLRSDVEFLGEKLTTSGKEIELTAAVFLTVNDDGKISRVVRVADTLGAARQLGIPAQQMQSLLDKFERRVAA